MATNTKFDSFVRKYGTPLSILVGAVLIAFSIVYSSGKFSRPAPTTAQKTTGAATGATNPVAAAPVVNVSADDDPALGRDGAKVVMIEFSDFQCPFCRKFWRESFGQIKQNYIDTGKVKFVYRDFPLTSLHPSSEVSAEAGSCANEQGKFWEMHDKIFVEQEKLGQGTVQFSSADLKKWAGEIGLNSRQFNSCLDTGKYKSEVEKDLSDGTTAGVQGTPTFFVNGKVIPGAVPYATIKQTIDDALKK